jgi:hypothetical protein
MAGEEVLPADLLYLSDGVAERGQSVRCSVQTQAPWLPAFFRPIPTEVRVWNEKLFW